MVGEELQLLRTIKIRICKSLKVQYCLKETQQLISKQSGADVMSYPDFENKIVYIKEDMGFYQNEIQAGILEILDRNFAARQFLEIQQNFNLLFQEQQINFQQMKSYLSSKNILELEEVKVQE